MQVHKTGKPIFIKEVGAAYLCAMPHVNQETTKLKALNSRSICGVLGLVHFYMKQVKAGTQISLCGCNAFALIKI
jgi:hypothetical protein